MTMIWRNWWMASVALLLAFGIQATASQSGSGSPIILSSMLLNYPAAFLVATALVAAGIHFGIQRRVFGRVDSSEVGSALASSSVFYSDKELEKQAEEVGQIFAVSARVITSHGIGTISAYNSESRVYSVNLDGGYHPRIKVEPRNIEAIRVVALYFYAIKSCAGVPVESFQLTARGVLHDREWMFVNEKGKLITQRRYSKMALIRPKLVPNVEHPTTILLIAEGMPDLSVPILSESDGAEANVSVWDNKMLAVDQGDAAADWINTYLSDTRGDHTFRLVRTKTSFRRDVSAKYAPGHETGFADDFPVTTILESSLAELNKHLKDPVLMNRFRPNIVLSGAPAFADDNWSAIALAEARLRNVRPISRCNLPCVNQETASVDPHREPTATLLRLRNGPATGFVGGKHDECFFGAHLVVEGASRIRVGVTAAVLSTKIATFA